MRKTARTAVPLGLLALCLLAPTGARGAATWSIRGAGWGHGIGMSQYGAYGYAKHGIGYRDILAHYYTDTAIDTAPSRTVRVLLRANQRRAAFTGAEKACGRKLDPGRTYLATRRDARMALRSTGGRGLATCDPPLVAEGPDAVTVAGAGTYRGALEVRPALFGGVNVINAVGLESYVKGVVPNESPSSWPIEALKAQSVAARTYALATGGGRAGFDQFADTRSQVYRGRSSETASTNQAVEDTAGQVITYGGKIAVTYFFSTSGGRTENIELAWPGSKPKPWLQSVRDPYDRSSPYHRWGPLRFSRAALESKLGGLVRGHLRDFEVIERGRSPRIVRADIVGAAGRTRVTGATLRSRIGLRDTWAYFVKITTGSRKPPDQSPPEQPPPTTTQPGSGGTPGSGGLGSGGLPPRASAAGIRSRLTGRVEPRPRSGWVGVERRQAGRWLAVVYARVDRRGAYRVDVPRGLYRITSAWATGPTVRVR